MNENYDDSKKGKIEGNEHNTNAASSDDLDSDVWHYATSNQKV